VIEVRCPDEGTLRAYLDEQLPPTDEKAVSEHLATCNECSAALAELKAQAGFVSHVLASAPVPEPAVDTAWRRLQARRAVPESRSLVGWRLRAMWQNMSTTSRRSALVGATLIALLLAVVFVEPVRVAAGQFLDVFRVRKLAVVRFDPDKVKELEGFDAQVFAEPEMDQADPVEVASPEEASEVAGYQVLVPSYLPEELGESREFVVEGAGTAKMEVNLVAARALLTMAGLSTDALPADVDQIQVTANIPPVVRLCYGEARPQPVPERVPLMGEVPRYYDAQKTLVVIQAPSPEVNVPEGLDVAAIGELGLQLLGLSPEEAQRLSQTIDWSTTLVIPVPTDVASVSEVTVHGVTGYLLRAQEAGEAPRETVVLWQEGDMLYAVTGNLPRSELLSVANSLQ